MQASIDDIMKKLTVYPTIVPIISDWRSLFEGGSNIIVYFERVEICRCSSLSQAAFAAFMLYFIFDVQYPAELPTLPIS